MTFVSATVMPRVSVVTVTLNNRPFVEETMRSVFAQTYSAIECVIVDGGSTDGTLDVIRAHANRLAAWTIASRAGASGACAWSGRPLRSGSAA